MQNGIVDPIKLPNMNLESVFLKRQLNVLEVKEYCIREDSEGCRGYFSLTKIKEELHVAW